MSIVKNKPRIYGLTGGIASGKSTSSKFFKDKGVSVFDSDAFVKSLWSENLELIETVNKKYNLDMKTKEGRSGLAQIIFNNDLERVYINSLVHPLVFSQIEEWLETKKDEDFVIIDMPLLFETGYESRVDKTIVIYTTKKMQINRLMKRDNLSQDEAKKRIKAQIDLKSKAKMGNFVIRNTKSYDHFYNQLELLYGGLVDESWF